MKSVVLIFAVVVVTVATPALHVHPAWAQSRLTEKEIHDLGARYPFFVVVPATDKKPLRFIYADAAQHLHALTFRDGRSRPDWETPSLGSPVTALRLMDDRTGETVLLVATLAGRILVYDLDDYKLRYEHLQDRFTNITCLVGANVDQDPQPELVFISDRILYVYDGSTRLLEWKTVQPYDATEILVANVDDDPQPEIILNSGKILDARFREVEVEAKNRRTFGRRIRLVDLNGDGYPEIVGETTGFPLTVFDIRKREEIW